LNFITAQAERTMTGRLRQATDGYLTATFGGEVKAIRVDNPARLLTFV
jgi:hypothetical protein